MSVWVKLTRLENTGATEELWINLDKVKVIGPCKAGGAKAKVFFKVGAMRSVAPQADEYILAAEDPYHILTAQEKLARTSTPRSRSSAG